VEWHPGLEHLSLSKFQHQVIVNPVLWDPLVTRHNMVCAGKVDLQTAQHEIATDWIKAYQKYIAKSPPSSEMHEPQFAPETATEGEVWVNTRSGKYWKPGSRYYGKTKQGRFMTEIDALDRRVLTSRRDGAVAYAKKPEVNQSDRRPDRSAGDG
jgi:hypothetical protein